MRGFRMMVLFGVAVIGAMAADVAGKWKGPMPTRGGGTRDVTFTFKVEGDKVTGTMADDASSSPIQDGKISGDTITFSSETQRGKRTYTGTVTATEIKFKREGGGQGPQEFVVKRVP